MVDLGISGLGPAVRIGVGGSAIVYRAKQDQLERDVAVKVLTSQDPSFLRRFEREARTLGQLSKLPGIVTVHGSGLTSQGEPYLIMEFCETSLLHHLYREGPLRPADAVAVMARVAATVAEAQAAGVLHRDIKPANILLTEDGEPMVTDFGISSVAGMTAGQSTSVGFTPGYVAPETLTGDPGGPAVDVYAIGATLFHLLSGSAPFLNDDGTNPNLLALAARIDAEAVPDLRPRGVPDRVCRLVESAMAKDPAARPTAAELADGLARCAADLRDEAGPAGAAPGGTLPDPGPAAPTPGAVQVDDAAGGDGLGGAAPLPLGSTGGPLTESARPAPSPAHLADSAPQPAGGRVPDMDGSPAVTNQAVRPLAPRGQPAQRDADRQNGERNAGTALVSALILIGATIATVLLFMTATGQSSDAPSDITAELATTTAVPLQTTTTGPFQTTTGRATTTQQQISNPFAGLPPPQSMAEWEERWAIERDTIVADVVASGFGLTDFNTLEGPDGFAINLEGCPSGWSDTTGIDDGTVTLGKIAGLTTLSAQGNYTNGLDAYFDTVNAGGGIGPNGLQIQLDVVDDGYVPASTRIQAEELVGRQDPEPEVFAVSTIGAPTTLAAYDLLNDSCVPHPFTMSGHPAFGDPIDHPWTTGLSMSMETEALIWGRFVEAQMAEPVTVGALVMDNEFGEIYLNAFEEFAASSPSIVEVQTVRHDPAGSSVTAEIEQFLDDPPDVLIAMTAGNPCLLTIQAVSETGLADVVGTRLLPSVCAFPPAYLIPAGADAADWMIARQPIKSGEQELLTRPNGGDDPYLLWVDEQLAVAGLDPTFEGHREGFGLYGWAYHQALEIAARLPGGLTRTNFVLAQRSMRSMSHPMLVDGAHFGMYGRGDPHFIEAADIAWFDVASGAWQSMLVLDVNGQTGPCSWQPGTGCAD